MSGHIYNEEGKKVLALSGAWNSHLDMQPCDEEGDPLPDSKNTRLWQVHFLCFLTNLDAADSPCIMLGQVRLTTGVVFSESVVGREFVENVGSSPKQTFSLSKVCNPDDAGSRVQCKQKPKGDKYGFTYFARMMNEGKGVAPLSSDSRRRPDRAALEVSYFISVHQHMVFMHSRQPLRISGSLQTAEDTV